MSQVPLKQVGKILVSNWEDVLFPSTLGGVITAFKALLSLVRYRDKDGNWVPVPVYYGYRKMDTDQTEAEALAKGEKPVAKYPKITLWTIGQREDKARNIWASNPAYREKTLDPTGRFMTKRGQPKKVTYLLQVTLHVMYDSHRAVIAPQIYNWLPDAFSIAVNQCERFAVKREDESPVIPPAPGDEETTVAWTYAIYAQELGLIHEEFMRAKELIIQFYSPAGDDRPDTVRVQLQE